MPEESAAVRRKAVVLYLIDTLRPGGAERLIVTTVAHLDPGRFTAVVVALAKPLDLQDELERLGITVHHLDLKNRRQWWRGVRDVARLLARHRVDILHTHLRFSNVYGRLAALIAGTPAVVTSLHHLDYTYWPATRWRQRGWKALDRATARFVNKGFIAVSAAVRDDYTHHFGIAGIDVLHNYLDVAGFAPTIGADPGERRAEFGWSNKDFVLVTVARLAREKGQRHLLHAMAAVVRSVPEVRLLLVGEGPDEGDLRRLVAGLGLEGAVAFAGNRSDVPALLAMADVFVFPSVSEGLGIAVMEAMAAARPVVASRADGIQELVTDGADGLLVPPANPEALAHAVVALHGDPERRRRLGEAARRTAIERFDARAGVRRLEAFYTRLLHERGRA